MKVNDYVRTKSGGIGKIIEIDNNCSCSHIITDNETFGLGWDLEQVNWDFITEIVKSSPNIIDLIEEHDILKIEEQKGVYTICEVEVFREPYEEYTFLGVRIDNRPIARKLYELNIKSIVTKEQFESMEYKVKE